MDVMEAIAAAKAYVQKVYADTDVSDLELEETERDGAEWRITLSFTRPRAPGRGTSSEAASVVEMLAKLQSGGRQKVHKVLVINPGGDVVAMKDRAWLEKAG